MFQAAKIILINPERKIFLALRDNKPEIPYPNHWAGIGGEIEKNETALEALKREIKEELSCEVKNITKIGEFLNPQRTCRIIMFKGYISEKIEKIKLYEGQRLGLFSFEDIKSILMPLFEKSFILNHKKEIFDN